MFALIATNNPDSFLDYPILLNALGYETQICSSLEKFTQFLEQNPDIIITPPAIQDISVLDIIPKYPKIRWFIQDQMSWSGAAKLFKSSGCEDVLFEIPSISNLFETICSTKTGAKTGTLSHYRWLKSATTIIQQQNTDDILENLDDSSPEMSQHCVSQQYTLESQFFNPKTSGTLSQTHFDTILEHIFSEKKTGVLHLWRKTMHWSITFSNGIPFDMFTHDEHGFFKMDAWAERHPLYKGWFSKSDCAKTVREKLREIPDAITLHKDWMSTLMLEIFSWPEADFAWKSETLFPKTKTHPQFSGQEIQQMLINGVFNWTPMAFILEVTQSCLPYFLKLKDNPEWSDDGLPNLAKAVAEKLKKGDTLSEMLATLSVDYPVHQVVYLFLMMRHLDLNA